MMPHPEKLRLALHQSLVKIFQEDPQKVINHALQNLSNWKTKGVESPHYDEWTEILHSHPLRIPNILQGEDPKSAQLQQASPFAGLIPEKTRLEILKKHHHTPLAP